MPLQATSGAASYDAFGGGVAAVPNYIEECFSTYLYTGNGSTQTINNGIDLAGEGGLVWVKKRIAAASHGLYDTNRGANNLLITNNTSAQSTYSGVSSFGVAGFNLGSGNEFNQSGQTFASWTFRKQPKFFDVVTYTGNGTGQTISHNLGSVPGCIIIKEVSGGASAGVTNWAVYHRSLGNTDFAWLNSTAAKQTSSGYWNNTSPTSTAFTVGSTGNVNESGGSFVAYLFAHDAGGFGLTGTDNVISCGSFTTDGSGNATVSLGYEPQWVLYKHTAIATDWNIFDNMRGMPVGSQGLQLKPNSSAADNQTTGYYPTSTGFQAVGLAASQPQIYIAIRRGPMKVPTSGTSVFAVDQGTASGSAPYLISGFPVDFAIRTSTSSAAFRHQTASRLTGSNYMNTTSTAAEASDPTDFKFDYMNGWGASALSTAFYSWMWRRAPSFMDVVCYTGTGVARTVAHNLQAVPQLIIVKDRSNARNWAVYTSTYGNSFWLKLNATDSIAFDTSLWNSTSPTSSVFTVGTANEVNNSVSNYVAYLFATCAGVSKVGSYTGTGTTLQINCGFTGGARFVLIKRTDSTGDWYVWDSARGIVSGNDPYLLLNSTAAEVTNTDYIDTYSAGFEISLTAPAAINASGSPFIFLAIA